MAVTCVVALDGMVCEDVGLPTNIAKPAAGSALTPIPVNAVGEAWMLVVAEKDGVEACR